MKALQSILIVFAFFTGCTQKKLVQEAPASKELVQEESDTFAQEESDASVIVMCDISNYKDFIYNYGLIDEHIKQHQKGCNLEGIIFKGMDMKGANFKKANLKGADFQGTDLKHVNFRGATMTGANFTNAKMEYAILIYAFLRDANLEGANLTGADLTSASMGYINLQNTNLTGANLQGVTLKDAIYNSVTQFPEGFSPKKHGMILVNEYVNFTR